MASRVASLVASDPPRRRASGTDAGATVETGRLVQLTWNLRSQLSQVSTQLQLMQEQRAKLVAYTKYLEQELEREKAANGAAAEAAQVVEEEVEEKVAKEKEVGAGTTPDAHLRLFVILMIFAWARQRVLNRALAHGVRKHKAEGDRLLQLLDDVDSDEEETEKGKEDAVLDSAAVGAVEEAANEAGGDEAEGGNEAVKELEVGDGSQSDTGSMIYRSDGEAEGSDEEDYEFLAGEGMAKSSSVDSVFFNPKRPRTTSAPLADIAGDDVVEEEDEDGPLLTDDEVVANVVQLRKKLEHFQTLLHLSQTPTVATGTTASRVQSADRVPLKLAIGGRYATPKPAWEKHRRRCSRLFRALVDPVESGLVSPATAAAAGRSVSGSQ